MGYHTYWAERMATPFGENNTVQFVGLVTKGNGPRRTCCHDYSKDSGVVKMKRGKANTNPTKMSLSTNHVATDKSTTRGNDDCEEVSLSATEAKLVLVTKARSS